jgi:hypothetical protein
MSSRRIWIGSTLPLAAVIFGCTGPNPNYCQKDTDCTGGRVCSVVHSACVFPDASTIPPDGSVGADAPATGDDAQPVDASGAIDGEPSIDGGADSEGDGSPADAAVDTRVTDATGICGVSGDCTDPTKAFCVGNVCVGCQSAGVNACVAPTPACDLTSGKCVGCTSDSQCTVDPAKGFCVAGSCTGCNTAGATGCAARTDGKTTCATTGTASGQCVACVADAQCIADPAKGFCVANACVGCNTTGATGCSSRTDGKTVCATTGTAAGQCVQCSADSQCTTDPTKGFCVANVCTGCNAPGATGCAARTDGKTTCATTGTAAGQCVACVADAQCTANPSKGFCVADVCTGCNTTGATGCTARTDGKNVCAATGTLAGQCVACVSSSDCKVATSPICTSNLCGACTADSQCSAKLGTTGNPGVCLNNIDGHCATDAETVYVQNVAGTCTDSGTGAGSAATPFCTARYAVTTAISTSGKDLVVMKGTVADFSIATPSKALTVVGQTATITPGGAGADGIDITSGTVYLRNLTVQGVTTAGSQTGVGINALPGSPVTLYVTGCTIKNNLGGILLNGAAFDIENTTVSNNAAGVLGAIRWGGILVNSPPTTGPAILNHVTIQNNAQVGLSCSAPITTSTTVLSSGNVNGSVDPADQISGCGFTSCTASGTGCGAQ